MYDPVTARFLQADTYLGNQADPLSLNLYTYCLNNPERYIDPSGHFALELAAILVTAVVLGMTIDIAIQKFVEQKVCIDLDRTITEGLFSGLIGLITFGGGLAVNTVGRTAASGIKAAGTVRTIANALISSAVFGATTEAAQDMAHQYFIEGRSLSQIDYRRVGISAALGAVISTGSTMVGAGINQLRAVRTGAHTTQLVGDVMQGGMPIGYNILQRPRMLKLNLQFFASKADDGVGRTVGDVVEKNIDAFGGKPDYIVTSEGVVMPTNQDFNLVSTIKSTDKGGEYLQIHNQHLHGELSNPHMHKPQVNIDPKTGIGSSKRLDLEAMAEDINYADKSLKDGTLRIRHGKKDKGGC